jgi:hypothetical protein
MNAPVALRKNSPVDTPVSFHSVLESSEKAVKTAYSEMQGKKMRMLEKMFRFYKDVEKRIPFAVKDLPGLPSRNSKYTTLLCQAELLTQEKVQARGFGKYLYHKSDSITSDSDVVFYLVSNVDKIVGWGRKGKTVEGASKRPDQGKQAVNANDTYTTTEVPVSPLATSNELAKGPPELKAFNEGWFQFKEIFPNLTFEDYFEAVYRNLELRPSKKRIE